MILIITRSAIIFINQKLQQTATLIINDRKEVYAIHTQYTHHTHTHTPCNKVYSDVKV